MVYYYSTIPYIGYADGFTLAGMAVLGLFLEK